VGARFWTGVVIRLLPHIGLLGGSDAGGCITSADVAPAAAAERERAATRRPSTLMGDARRSLLFSAIDRYLTQVLVIATTATMARILTPAETGLFLVAHAVILLVENFRDFGVGAYIVQERQLSRTAVQSAFTVTVLLSLAMGGAVCVGAGQIALFYGEPELRSLLIVAALGLLFVPFGSPIMALLRRDLAFKAIAGINVAAAVANAVVTIVLGMAGYGAVSYIWGYVAASALLALLAFLARPQLWVFRPTLVGCRRVLSFGTISSFVTVVNMAYDLLPRLALGKILGFDAVGLYSRAVTVCQLPDRAIVSALQPVVLPAMAARARAGGDLKDSYLRGHALMSAIQWPALIMLALLADPIVRVLLGEQWLEVAPLARLIALATMALAPAFMTYPLLVSVGRVRDTLASSLISLPPSVLIVVGAVSFGLEAVAASLFIAAPLQMLVALLFIRRAIGLTWVELVHASRNSMILAIGTALLPGIVIAFSPTGFVLDLQQTVLSILGGALGWLTGLWLTDHPLKREIVAGWHLVKDSADLRRLSAVVRHALCVPKHRAHRQSGTLS
jgi:O-antigen/teichoic acid export membrane protein